MGGWEEDVAAVEMEMETYIQYLRNSNRQTNRIHQFNRHIYSWNLHKFGHAWTTALKRRAIYNAAFILVAGAQWPATLLLAALTCAPPMHAPIVQIVRYAYTMRIQFESMGMLKFPINSNFHFKNYLPFNWGFYSFWFGFASFRMNNLHFDIYSLLGISEKCAFQESQQQKWHMHSAHTQNAKRFDEHFPIQRNLYSRNVQPTRVSY